MITLVDTRWTPGPSFFPDGRVIPQMLNCSASLRASALAYRLGLGDRVWVRVRVRVSPSPNPTLIQPEA